VCGFLIWCDLGGGSEGGRRVGRGGNADGDCECMVELVCVFMHDWLEIANGPPLQC
jgi:hypothetical protein